MSRAGRIPTPILVGVGLLILGGVAVTPWFQLAELRQQIAAKQKMIASLTAKNEQFQEQLTAVDNERKAMESRLNGVRNELNTATDELSKLRDVQLRFDILKEEKTRLESQVGQLKQERDEAQQRLTRLKDENDDLEHAAVRLRNRLSLLDRDYQHLSARLSEMEQHQSVNQASSEGMGSMSPITLPTTGAGPNGPSETGSPTPQPPPEPQSAVTPVITTAMATPSSESMSLQTIELPPIVVRKNQAVAGALVQAKLVEVNQPHRFVVINQGLDDGVQIGMTFDVMRGSRAIAQAVAVRVRPRISACDLIMTESTTTPQIGDLVIQRGP